METTEKKEIEQANEVIAEMLLDVLYQACAIQEESDNEFIENGRIYFLTEKAKKLK